MAATVDLELDLQGAFSEDALSEADAAASRMGLVGDVVPRDDVPDDHVVTAPGVMTPAPRAGGAQHG